MCGRSSASPVTLYMCWQVDDQIHACYAQTMSEWLGCEAIVRQRERESHAAALAKCSSGASLDSHLHRMLHRDSTISNEVADSWPGRMPVRGGPRDSLTFSFMGRGDFRVKSRFEFHPESLASASPLGSVLAAAPWEWWKCGCGPGKTVYQVPVLCLPSSTYSRECSVTKADLCQTA